MEVLKGGDTCVVCFDVDLSLFVGGFDPQLRNKLRPFNIHVFKI